MSQMKKRRLRVGGDLPEPTRLLLMTPVLSVLPQRQWGLWFPLCGASGLTWSWGHLAGQADRGQGFSCPRASPCPLADTQISGAPSPPPCLRQPPNPQPLHRGCFGAFS